MSYITRLLVNLSLVFCICAAVSAQTLVGPTLPPAPITVAVSLTAAGFRFTALGPVRHTRLEVFDASGALVFDSGFLPGGVRVWSPQQTGQTTPADGTYQCVVTARDLSGRLSLKQGAVEVSSPLTQQELLSSLQSELAEFVYVIDLLAHRRWRTIKEISKNFPKTFLRLIN